MKVLFVGYSKTGTKSMHVALKTLGYKVYDYDHNFYYLRKEWTKILTKGGTKDDWYNMYKDVDASMDIPVCLFWEEILEAFPDCKLIFNERPSEEVWWQSAKRTADNIDYHIVGKIVSCLSKTSREMLKYARLTARVGFATPNQNFLNVFRGISPTVAKKRYRDHNSSVKLRAPKNQMLTFSPSEGWEPLCKFLNKPIPDVEFPHRNKDGTVLDDLFKESPVFHQMIHEAKISLAIIVVFISFAFYWFMF